MTIWSRCSRRTPRGADLQLGAGSSPRRRGKTLLCAVRFFGRGISVHHRRECGGVRGRLVRDDWREAIGIRAGVLCQHLRRLASELLGHAAIGLEIAQVFRAQLRVGAGIGFSRRDRVDRQDGEDGEQRGRCHACGERHSFLLGLQRFFHDPFARHSGLFRLKARLHAAASQLRTPSARRHSCNPAPLCRMDNDNLAAFQSARSGTSA